MKTKKKIVISLELSIIYIYNQVLLNSFIDGLNLECNKTCALDSQVYLVKGMRFHEADSLIYPCFHVKSDGLRLTWESNLGHSFADRDWDCVCKNIMRRSIYFYFLLS